MESADLEQAIANVNLQWPFVFPGGFLDWIVMEGDKRALTGRDEQNGAWRVEMLGGLQVRRGDECVRSFRTRKCAALLAFLAFHRGPHPREALIELLWPGIAPDAGRNNLRVTLSQLRARFETTDASSAALSPRLLRANRVGVALCDSVSTDVEAFEHLLREASAVFSAPERVGLHERAVALYRGPLLPGFYDDWIPLEEARLEVAYLHALQSLTAFYQAEDADRAQHFAFLAARRASLPSPLASSRVSRRATPQFPANAAPHEPTEPAIPLEPPTWALPIPLTRCFGRENEIARLQELLSAPQTRLVTLLGAGGLGKTRLALETAQLLQSPGAADINSRQNQTFSATLWRAVLWVPLADVLDAERLPEALISALRLSAEAADNHESALERVARALRLQCRDGRVLLLLDNFEQLLPGGAPIVCTILEKVPQLVVLATSRRALRIAGESEMDVPPLALPPETLDPDEADLAVLSESASLRLFADRARLARSDWHLSAREAPLVASVVRRLEGVPLAIELVAARVGVLSASQMLSRLEGSLGWVASRRPEMPPRHRSLRAALAWSFDLLTPADRAILARLSAFRGGWILEDAGELLPETPPDALLDALQELREASLLTSREDEHGDLRFSMLEVVRHYAGDLLDSAERESIERRHAEFYFDLAARASQEAGNMASRRSQVISESRNFSAALDFWMREDIGRALQMAASLWWLWVSGPEMAEGRRRLRELLQRAESARFPLALARAQSCAAYLAVLDGDEDEAEPLLQAALAVWRGQAAEPGLSDSELRPDSEARGQMASIFNLLGAVANSGRDLFAARNFYAQSLELRRGQNDTRELLIAINALAGAECKARRFDQTRQLCEEALSMGRAQGIKGAIAWTLHTLGFVALEEGDFASARACQQESLALRQEDRQPSNVAICWEALGEISIREGDFPRARREFGEALGLWRSQRRAGRVRAVQERLKTLESAD